MTQLAAAVIFDLDGTLADTLLDIASAMNHALSEQGLPPHEPARYREFIGEGVQKLAKKAAGERDARLSGALAASFRRRYADHLLDETRAYPGIDALLGELVRRGVPIGVLSNKPDDATQRVVRALFPATPFVRISGQRPEWPRKPDPTLALSIAEDMGRAPDQCALLGDSEIDIQTARRAGMIPLGALWGFRQAQELQRAGARSVLTAPQDLLGLVARHPSSRV